MSEKICESNKLNNLYKSYISNNYPDKGIELTNQIIEIIKETHNKTHNKTTSNDKNQELINFIMIVLYKRQLKIDTNCRSRDIFYNTILQLYNTYSEIIMYIIKLDIITEFGYYKDYFNIWKHICVEYDKQETDEQRYKIFLKYNHLVLSIIEIVINQRYQDLRTIDTFLKELNFENKWSQFGLDGIITHDSNNRIDHLKLFINSVDYSYINISKVGMWIPREDKIVKQNNKNKKNNTTNNTPLIFWFSPYNNVKKVNCYDLLVSQDKVINKLLCDSVVYSSDKKIFRIENSILNAFIGTPQQEMCKSNCKNIYFTKTGSRFIYKNKQFLLNKDTNKIKNKYDDEQLYSSSNISSLNYVRNLFIKNLFYYKYDRIETRSNLIKHYIDIENNKKKQVVCIDLNQTSDDNNWLDDIYELDIFIPVKHYFDFYYECA
jgi:hypothetical protein